MGSMVTSTVASSITMLQFKLGLLVREKRFIDNLNEYRVTALYNEIRRFKISAAATAPSIVTRKTFNQNNGLIEEILNNFDANLNTQNSLKQMHSLATIITRYCSSTETSKRQTISQFKKPEPSTVELQDIKMQMQTREKKPSMPNAHATVGMLPLKVLWKQAILVLKSNEDDFVPSNHL